MKTNSKIDDLAQKIALLKNKQQYDLEMLKTHFHYTYEGLKPINLIKEILHNAVSSTEIKKDLLKGVIGYFTNKIFSKKNNSPIMKAINFVLNKFATN